MAVLFDPLFQAVNASGAPYAGARLNFYRSGTTSRVTVYKNAQGSTPHTNPVIADSAGIFAPIYLDTVYPLKAILQSAAGVTIMTIDRFDPAPGGVTGNSYTVETAADLPAPSNEFAEGIVLNDPDPTKDGLWYREGGAWAFGRPFEVGPKGADGAPGPYTEITFGAVSTGAPGTPVVMGQTPTEAGVKVDFTIPSGRGPVIRGDYNPATAYVLDDAVLDNGSTWIALQTTTGNAPPVLPATSNAHWQLLARKGTDGEIDGVTPFWVSRLGSDADAAAARTGLGVLSAQETVAALEEVAGGKQQWLLIADAQPYPGIPESEAQVAKWKQICFDVAVRHPDLDAIYFEGDLIAYANQPLGDPNYYHFADWLKDIAKTGVPFERIYTIAGNHDASWELPPSTATLSEYLKHFKKLNYASYNGNFLNIHLSDLRYEDGPHTGNIDNATLEWFRQMVRSHQDTHNIILHIHQPIGNTTAGSSMLGDITWRQDKSAELAAFIRDDPRGKVDLVLHGHNDWGLPGGTRPYGDNGGSTSMGVDNQVFAHTAWHVNVGLHIPSYINPVWNPGNLPMSYCTAEVEEGATDLTIKRWNVDTGAEVIDKRLAVPLRHPVRIAGGECRDTRSDKLTGQIRGTWTPTISFTGGNGNFAPTFTQRLGTFVRDGDVVHFSIRLQGTTNAYSGASGLLRVDLPLPPLPTQYSGASIGIGGGLQTTSTARSLTAYVASPGSVPDGIYFRESTYTTGVDAALGPANLPPSMAFNIVLGGTYFLPEKYDSL